MTGYTQTAPSADRPSEERSDERLGRLVGTMLFDVNFFNFVDKFWLVGVFQGLVP